MTTLADAAGEVETFHYPLQVSNTNNHSHVCCSSINVFGKVLLRINFEENFVDGQLIMKTLKNYIPQKFVYIRIM